MTSNITFSSLSASKLNRLSSQEIGSVLVGCLVLHSFTTPFKQRIMTGVNKTDETKTVISIIMDVPGCDDGSLVVFRVFLVTAISQSVITPNIVLSGNPLQLNGLSLRSTILKLGSCSLNTEKFT